MTAATAGCSSTQRVATFAIETPCLPRDRGERAQNVLQHVPAADLVDEALVFHLAPVGDVAGRRLRPAEPFLGEQAAGERAVGEELEPLARQNALMSSAARRSSSEKQTWLVAIRNARASRAARRWSVSKLVTPRWPISPSSLQLGELAHARRDRRDARRSTSGTAAGRSWSVCSRVEARSTAARTRLGRHRAGRRAPFGEDRRRASRPRSAPPCGDQPVEAAGDVLGAAVVVGHVEGVEAGLGIGAPGRPPRASRSSARPSRSMSATCQRPVTMRLIVRPGASSMRSGTVGFGMAIPQ